jgi:lipoic acid synthetase
VEVLIPDFNGNAESLAIVLEAGPDVLNHNIESVARLYDTVRPGAIYKQSLALLQRVVVSKKNIPSKSGLMLGLGETDLEIQQTLKDLRQVGCRFLTLGQYLQPSKDHLPVDRFIRPEEFLRWKKIAEEIGFAQVASGPFVRSSYHAKDLHHSSIR